MQRVKRHVVHQLAQQQQGDEKRCTLRQAFAGGRPPLGDVGEALEQPLHGVQCQHLVDSGGHTSKPSQFGQSLVGTPPRHRPTNRLDRLGPRQVLLVRKVHLVFHMGDGCLQIQRRRNGGAKKALCRGFYPQGQHQQVRWACLSRAAQAHLRGVCPQVQQREGLCEFSGHG
eukprot:gene26090-32620_t